MFCNSHRETAFRIFVHYPYIKIIWDFITKCLSVKGRLGSLRSPWIVWRKKRVRNTNRILWDTFIMATVWALWSGGLFAQFLIYMIPSGILLFCEQFISLCL